jgi:predicted ABC-type ATPase
MFGDAARHMPVQRKLDFTVAVFDDLAPERSATKTRKDVATALGKQENTWAIIRKALRDYWEIENVPAKSKDDLTEQLKILQNISATIGTWKRKHPDKFTGPKWATLEKLSGKVWPEINFLSYTIQNYDSIQTAIRAKKLSQEEYFRDLKDPAKFKYLSQTAKGFVVPHLDKYATEAEEHGLTAAELAAIRLYTLDDYKYINPGAAYGKAKAEGHRDKLTGLDKWMESKIPEIQGMSVEEGEDDDKKRRLLDPEMVRGKGRRRARQEAYRHAEMIVSGLKKLPKYKGMVYRGFTAAKKDFKSDWARDKIVPQFPFISSSTNPLSSIVFIKEELVKASKDEKRRAKGEIGVLLRVYVGSGARAIEHLSLVPGEGEVLWVPGRKIKVTRVSKATDEMGTDRASEEFGDFKTYLVDAVQVNKNDEEKAREKTFADSYIDDKLSRGGDPDAGAAPEAVLLMGGPASGKSTVVNQLGLAAGRVRVDADDVKENMEEYKQGLRSKDSKIAAKVHAESKRIAGSLTGQAILHRKNLLYDGTGGNKKEYTDMIGRLKSRNYKVSLYITYLTAKEGKKRASKRAKATGREVPEEVIKATYFDVSQNAPPVAALADKAQLYSNMGDKPELLWEKGKSTQDLAEVFKELDGRGGKPAKGVL